MNKKDIYTGLFIALVLSGAISMFASGRPDGLEKVAKDKGFLEKGQKSIFTSPLSGYLWPGVKNERLATSISGIAGTLVVFGFGYGLAVLLRRRKNK